MTQIDETTQDTTGRTTEGRAGRRRGRQALAETDARRRAQYGGMKPGAAFFGWLVAIGMTVLLAAVTGAVGAALGVSAVTLPGAAATGVATVGITGAIIALAVLAVAYYAGGYVAGRLARFDGARNGMLTWLIGLLVTIAAAVAAATVGSRYDMFAQVQLPAVPLTAEQLTVSGILALVALVGVTLLAAVLGGVAGQRYHRKVDRVGVDSM